MKLEWVKVKEESYKAGYRKMLRKTFVLPDGSEAEYDIKDEPTSCHILALTPENKVVLEKVFRPGTEEVVLDMPAGFVDEGESPEEAAERELLEETGMKGDVKLAGVSTDDAYTNTKRHTFVITNCKMVAETKLDNDEVFEIVLMDVTEFRKHLQSGKITHAEAGYIGLEYLNLL